VTELEHFTIQQQLSREMSYLTLLTVGIARLEARDYEGAIAHFTDALTLGNAPERMVNPADIYALRGMAYFLKPGSIIADLDHAIADFTEAIQHTPDNAELYSNRAAAHGSKEDLDRGLTDATEAIYLNPTFAEAYLNRGLILVKKGNGDGAIMNYNVAIALKPDYASAYNNRGSALSQAGEDHVESALADINQAIQLKPDFANAYVNRGLVYEKKATIPVLKRSIDMLLN
jgi:tetratricopeptide (TPR) repeat protein